MKLILGLAIFSGFPGGCLMEKQELPVFDEKIIDHQAPGHLWMKSIGDINGDKKVDILVGGHQTGGLVAYLAPSWEKMVLNDSFKISTDAEVGDVNKDGNADVIAVADRAIVWFQGPEWEVHLIDSLIGHDVEAHDFNSDGLIDAVVRNQGEFGTSGGHTLYFYYQSPGGEWIKNQKEIPDGEGLKMADINGDGKMDIITNGVWFENTGEMDDWPEHKYTNTWTWPNVAVDVADINGDGRADIILSPSELAGTHYHISWFEAPSNPSATWKEHIVADSVETVCHSAGAADMNQDGKADIIVAEMQQGEDPDEVIIFYNLGKNRWEKQAISTGGSHSMRLYDFDEDGDIDILGANWRESVVKLWINESKQNK